MKSTTTLLFFFLLMTSQVLFGQDSYFGGKFRKKAYTTTSGHTYTLYDFSREGYNIKAKYFATDAYNQYRNWKAGKRILLVTAGAFSDGYVQTSIPVGLCVDNGKIINRAPDPDMDAMVIIYNGGEQEGGVAIVDMDINPVRVENPMGSGTRVPYYPRTSITDRINFLNWGQTYGITLFQSQLVYSSDRTSNFERPYYGNKRERRFLAICRKNGTVHHVVVDGPDDIELNLSASYAKAILDFDGFTVLYIMNLDTGAKNILHAYNGTYLENLVPNRDAKIEDATNLLVYYTDL